MNEPTTLQRPGSQVDQLTAHAASQADQALNVTKRVATDALDAVQQQLPNVASRVSEAAAKMEDLARRGMDKAADISAEVRSQAGRASDRTVGYIKDEPIKAVLIAAAAGAALAMLARVLSRDSR